MLKRITPFLLAAFLLTLVLYNPGLAQSENVSYGVLVDNTGSLRSQFREVLMISKGFVELNYQRASISLFSFKSEGVQRNQVAVIASGSGWTQDKADLNDYIDSLFVVPGQTTLKDAISAIAQDLNSRASLDKAVEKCIVVISDGEDRGSKIKEKQLIKALTESGIKVYAIGLTQSLEDDGGPKAFLKKITEETGGRVIFPKSKQFDVDALLRELLAK